ncbi:MULTISPECIES: cellulose-binding domain-containing protein [unclassified Streptomyces]|uniref:cellulose-binding domain-containing protein n=1 Tax=unclassified Streptomyces TaxID=2593676 RepID=UPI003331F45D
MPDLPTPQDATEAALFSEGWDAVLSYADLCTSGSLTAHQLANEAFALGMREVRAAASTHVRGAGRTARLPTIPALLTAVRDTATAWEAGGQGHRLDPDLRLWLNSPSAARFSGPPLQRPVALRGLRDMQEADASLLWLAEVEALPLPTVARRLGLDPATVTDELDQVRTLFRDRCHRAHLDTPLDPECRSYARLLDAVTRSAAADAPEDLSRHLATCVRCAEAAACLRLHGGGLPAALTGGVVGWGGLAYLERRRRAAEVRLGAPAAAPPDAGDPADEAGGGRVLRRGLLAAAVLLSALALGVSLMPFDGSGDETVAAHQNRRPVVGPDVPGTVPHTTHAPPRTATPTVTPPAPATSATAKRKKPGPEPRETSATTHPPRHSTAPATPEAAACRVAYDVTDQWADGFQATVSVTTDRALTGWQVAWSFRDGQRVGQMWDATGRQDGSRVTATAADYNKAVAAHGTLSFGFIGSLRNGNRAPYDFTLDGAPCTAG